MKSTLFLRALLLLSFLSISIFGFSQDEPTPQYYLDSIFQYSMENSVMKDSVDWAMIKKEYYKLGKSAKTTKDIIPSVKFLLKSLDDYHGRVWIDKIPYNGKYKEPVSGDFKLPTELVKDYQWAKIPILGDVIKKKYGYIQVPAIYSGQNNAEDAKKIHEEICKVQNKYQPEGWILDLRLNGGGTMYPMLVGLSPFLGEDTVGYFMDKSTGYEEAWHIQNGELFFNDYQVTNYELNLEGCEDLNLKDAKVAVLIAATTTSSGEVTTLSFRNRNNSILIGEKTGAYTTTASWLQLSPNVAFQLSISFYADRKKEIFEGTSIPPDILVNGGENLDNLEKDKMVLEAINWIEEK